MQEAQGQRRHPILAVVLLVLLVAPTVLDLLDDLGAEGVGEIAWEFAHGLPKWRRKFGQGWRKQAETERDG